MHPFARIANRDALALVVRAQLALGLTQRTLADAVGSSLRTVQRWSSGESHPHAGDIRKLAVLVHPRDADLAAKLAAFIEETPESLGLVVPSPPTAPDRESGVASARAPHILAALAESVVAAAAEAMDVSPRLARPGLLAALVRAEATGVGIDDLLSVLAPAPARTPKKRSRRP